MGCGSSGATATQQSKNEPLRKDQPNNAGGGYNYPGKAILFVDPGTDKLYDLTSAYFSQEHHLYTGPDLEQQNPQNAELGPKLKSAEQVIVILDIGFLQPVLFVQKILPKFGIDKNKIQYLIVTPTKSTPQIMNTVLSSAYRLILAFNQTENDNIHFIERSFFYTSGIEDVSYSLGLFFEKRKTTNFHPKGPQTKAEVEDWVKSSFDLLYSSRSYVHFYVGIGFEQGEFSEGYEQFLKLIPNLPTGSEYPVHANSATHPAIAEIDDYVLVTTLGGGLSDKVLGEIKYGRKVPFNSLASPALQQQALILLDPQNITKDELAQLSKNVQTNPSLLRVVALLLPADTSQWFRFGHILNSLVENTDFTILLHNSDQPAHLTNHVSLLNSLLSINLTLSEIQEHQTMFPRLHFVQPFYGNVSDPSNYAPISDHSIQSVVTINQNQNLSPNQFIVKVPSSNAVFRVDDETNPSFRGGLVHNFQEVARLFSFFSSNQDEFIQLLQNQYQEDQLQQYSTNCGYMKEDYETYANMTLDQGNEQEM